MDLAEQALRRVLAVCAEGDMLRTQLAILRRLGRHLPANAVELSRTVPSIAFRWRNIRCRCRLTNELIPRGSGSRFTEPVPNCIHPTGVFLQTR